MGDIEGADYTEVGCVYDFSITTDYNIPKDDTSKENHYYVDPMLARIEKYWDICSALILLFEEINS